MKSFIAKRVISIFVNLRYLRFKLLIYKENNKKICYTFDHNFKNIPLYIMSNVSLERYYFVLYDGALTLKMSKMALNAFCDKTLHIVIHLHVIRLVILADMERKIAMVEGVYQYKNPRRKLLFGYSMQFFKQINTYKLFFGFVYFIFNLLA